MFDDCCALRLRPMFQSGLCLSLKPLGQTCHPPAYLKRRHGFATSQECACHEVVHTRTLPGIKLAIKDEESDSNGKDALPSVLRSGELNTRDEVCVPIVHISSYDIILAKRIGSVHRRAVEVYSHAAEEKSLLSKIGRQGNWIMVPSFIAPPFASCRACCRIFPNPKHVVIP